MAQNKSNTELFAFFSDFAYDIKEKITEYEYIQLMEHLKVLFDKINENEEENEHQHLIVNPPQINVILPEINMCNCLEGQYEWCTNDIASFQSCTNYNSFIAKIPIIKYALHYINIDDEQIDEPLPYLHLETKGNDIDTTEENKNKFLKHIKCCVNLIDLHDNKKYKSLVSLSVFDFCIQNIYFPIKYQNYLVTIIEKVNEFIIDEIVIFEWISNIFNLNGNILYVYKDIFERIYLQNQLTSL